MHVEGDAISPLFSGLTSMAIGMALKMLIHGLENRRQQWAVSDLPNALVQM